MTIIVDVFFKILEYVNNSFFLCRRIHKHFSRDKWMQFGILFKPVIARLDFQRLLWNNSQLKKMNPFCYLMWSGYHYSNTMKMIHNSSDQLKICHTPRIERVCFIIFSLLNIIVIVIVPFFIIFMLTGTSNKLSTAKSVNRVHL